MLRQHKSDSVCVSWSSAKCFLREKIWRRRSIKDTLGVHIDVQAGSIFHYTDSNDSYYCHLRYEFVPPQLLWSIMLLPSIQTVRPWGFYFPWNAVLPLTREHPFLPLVRVLVTRNLLHVSVTFLHVHPRPLNSFCERILPASIVKMRYISKPHIN